MTKNKAKATKVTKQELKDIQLIVQNINNIQFQIGGVEVQKSHLLNNIFQAKNEFAAYNGKLNDKYGDVVVNINDGSLKPKENEQINKKN